MNFSFLAYLCHFIFHIETIFYYFLSTRLLLNKRKQIVRPPYILNIFVFKLQK